MPDSIFDPESTQKQLDKLRELPPDQGGIGAVVEGTDVGVRGTWHKDIGKKGGWYTAGEGSFMKRAGAKLAWWLGWKGDEK